MSNMSSKEKKEPYVKQLSGIEIADPKGDFIKLEESQKEEVINRAKLLFNEYQDMYEDPVFSGLTYRTNIGQIMSLFIEKNKPIANMVYELMFDLRQDKKNTDETNLMLDQGIDWLTKIMHLLGIELYPDRFSGEVIIKYWLPRMEGMKMIQLEEDGVVRTPEPSEAIIWNLLMAKAETVYGIRLMNSGNPAKWEELEGLCDILKDELIRLDKFLLKDKDKEFIDLVTEIKKLSEYWLIRYVDDSSYDDPEGKKELTSRETISILGNVSEKAVVNAGLKGEIEIKKITEREDREPVAYYQTDSALEWLQDQKRRHKFNYLPSLKASNKYEDRDNFLVIPAESIEELGRFIEEHSPGSFDKPRDENTET